MSRKVRAAMKQVTMYEDAYTMPTMEFDGGYDSAQRGMTRYLNGCLSGLKYDGPCDKVEFERCELSCGDFRSPSYCHGAPAFYHVIRFEMCEMTRADFTGCRFSECEFVRCRLWECDFTGSWMTRDVKFIDCDLTLARFSGSVLSGAYFGGCRFSYHHPHAQMRLEAVMDATTPAWSSPEYFAELLRRDAERDDDWRRNRKARDRMVALCRASASLDDFAEIDHEMREWALRRIASYSRPKDRIYVPIAALPYAKSGQAVEHIEREVSEAREAVHATVEGGGDDA